jgi:hypothetical protein
MSRHLFGFAALMVVVLGLGRAVHAAPVSYQAIMSGPAESPTNSSPGIGYGTVDVDTMTHFWHLHCDFSGLTGTTTASHIHSPTAVAFTGTAGVATTTPSFAGFPLGVTSGTYDNTLDMTQSSSYNPSFVSANGGTPTSAELALAQGIADGKAYWNIHTQTFGGGEIRGFLIPLPEPGSALILGAGAMFVMRRRRDC